VKRVRVRINLAALKRIKVHEYATRFLLGGILTVITGWIASTHGPVIGGLFLSFPAIFPASATLLEKHEREKRQRAGISHTIRGRLAAAIDARGTALGSLGMVCFAVTAWRLLPDHSAAWVLPAALVIWLTVSVICWRARELSIDLFAWLRRDGSTR
jgi:hypothetical protein